MAVGRKKPPVGPVTPSGASSSHRRKLNRAKLSWDQVGSQPCRRSTGVGSKQASRAEQRRNGVSKRTFSLTAAWPWFGCKVAACRLGYLPCARDSLAALQKYCAKRHSAHFRGGARSTVMTLRQRGVRGAGCGFIRVHDARDGGTSLRSWFLGDWDYGDGRAKA